MIFFATKWFANNHCEKIHIGDFGDVNRNLDKISLVFVVIRVCMRKMEMGEQSKSIR